MQIFKYLVVFGLAASTYAAPAGKTTPGGKLAKSSLPGADPKCVGDERSKCLASGVEPCGSSFGGPSRECDVFCKAYAEKKCQVTSYKTCPYDNLSLCMGDNRSKCLQSKPEPCREPHFGGPSFECDTFCREQAAESCQKLGC